MIQILLTWIYIFITSYCVGDVIVRQAERRLRNKSEKKIHPVLTSLAGLVIITVVAGYFSLFLKTGLVFNALLWLFCLVYLFKRRGSFFSLRIRGGINWLTLSGMASLLAIVVLLLVKASGPITTPDSGAYHLPFIRWIEDYPVIKGLANLHSRFGFDYQYHVLCAVYGFSFLGLPTVHAMNAYLMLMLMVYLTSTLSVFSGKSFAGLDIVRLIILLFTLNMSNASSSFSPDFPTTCMILFAVLLTLERLEENVPARFDRQALLIFTITIGAVLFKISSLPIFLINIFFLLPLLKGRKWTVLAGLVLAGVIYIAPYLIRNYYISGYLVYPLYSLDLFHVPWKVPFVKAFYEKEVILTYALGLPYGSHPGLSAKIHSWIPYLKATNRAYVYVVGLLLACIAFNLVTFIWLLTSKQAKRYANYILLYALLYICLLYWWENAPDPRFGNGYIISFIAITIGMPAYMLFKRYYRLIYAASYMLIIVLAVGMIKGEAFSKVAMNYNRVHYNNFVFQEKYPVPDTTAYPGGEGRVIYKVPNLGGCWDITQPCCLQQDSCNYAGAEIQDGFTSKK